MGEGPVLCTHPSRGRRGESAIRRALSLCVGALLRLTACGSVLVQRVNWGATLEPSDLLLPTLNDIGRLYPVDPTLEDTDWQWYATPNAWQAAQAAASEQQTYIQFRLIRDPDIGEGFVNFVGPVSYDSARHPKLVMQYTPP